MFQNHLDQAEIFSALQHLKHNKHEVLLFHVTDQRTELDFEFEDRPYEFVDIESGEKLRLKPSQIRETYRRQMKKYYLDLKLKCNQFKIDFIEADIKDPYDKVLTAYLIKRAKMK